MDTPTKIDNIIYKYIHLIFEFQFENAIYRSVFHDKFENLTFFYQMTLLKLAVFIFFTY